jgi:3-hydroxyisobutyrate dehydrogenase
MDMTTSSIARDVAVIGLGQMGRGIARAIDRGGRLGAVWDSSGDAIAAADLSPAVRIAPPSQQAGIRYLIFVVPGSAEIEATLFGPGGVLQGSADKRIIIDLTTSAPAATVALAKRAAAVGCAYIDCGMSGGAMAADAGRVTLMVGGAEDAVSACEPIFDLFAGARTHVGPSGAGHTIKLIHNMICHSIFLLTTEGCRTARRAGIDLDKAVAVLNSGNARSFISEVRFPKHILTGTFDGRSRMSNLKKDLEMAATLAGDLGQPAVYAPLAAQVLKRATNGDEPDRDFTLLFEEFDDIINTLKNA